MGSSPSGLALTLRLDRAGCGPGPPICRNNSLCTSPLRLLMAPELSQLTNAVTYSTGLLVCAVSNLNKSLTSSHPDVAGPTQAASQTSIAFFDNLKGKLACSAPAGGMGIVVIAFIQLA